jgi:hypothetical protein
MDDLEIVPDNVSASDLRDEVNRRTAKAGYTTRNGECPYRTKIMIMPPTRKYRENYVKAFGHD